MSDEIDTGEEDEVVEPEVVESPALAAERISKEFSNETSPTGPPAEPISDGTGAVDVDADDEEEPA